MKYYSNTIIKSSIIVLIILGFFVYNFIPVISFPDSIWTTRDDCGDETQDVNHYTVGDHVYINGEGFSPGDYYWEIKGKPGGASCDPGQIVANGTVTVGSIGDFCFDAYTIANDDCGEYQVKLDTKGDNYKVTGEVFDCSDYTNEDDCNYFNDCEWCYECDGKKWSGGPDRCIDVGTCNYECVVDHCGAECLPGQTAEKCLPDGAEILTCFNYVSYEYPEYNYCKDTCEWDNCKTKNITEDDPRCYQTLPRPSCDGEEWDWTPNTQSWDNYGSCPSCSQPSFNYEIPTFNYEPPKFNMPKPSFDFPKFDFPSFNR